MAEIRVEPKRHGTSKAWLWILLLVIVVGAGVWYFASIQRHPTTATRTDTTATESAAGAIAPPYSGSSTAAPTGANTGTTTGAVPRR